MQQRYYDPQIGRFLSNDPVATNPTSGGNFNRYWYGNDNPFRFTDPDGRVSKGTYTGTDPNKKTAEQRRSEQAARTRKNDAPYLSGGAMNGGTQSGGGGRDGGPPPSDTPKAVAHVTSGLATSAGVGAKAVEKLGEFEKYDDLVKNSKGAGKVVAGLGTVLSLGEVATADNPRDMAHGAVFSVLGGLELAQPELTPIIMPIQVGDMYLQNTSFSAYGRSETGWYGASRVAAVHLQWNGSFLSTEQ